MNLKINFAVCLGFLPCATSRHTAKLPFFAVCLSMWHTAKVALFVVCLGQGTRQRGCVCRVPSCYGTRQTGCSTGFATSALYFAVGPEIHSAKYLPCARNVAYGKQALCRPLYTMSCFPCVTLGKVFAECKPAFAVCPGHTANSHSLND